MTRRQKRRYDDDEDKPGILRDGEALRVPMWAMDSAQLAVYEAAKNNSNDSRPPSGLHNRSPGFVVADNDMAARERKQSAYESYVFDMQNAWRQGDDQGRPGQMLDVRRVPEQTRQDAATMDDREAAYRDHEYWLTNAWRQS